MYRGTNKSVDLSQRSTDSVTEDQETRGYVDLPDLVRLWEQLHNEYIV